MTKLLINNFKLSLKKKSYKVPENPFKRTYLSTSLTDVIFELECKKISWWIFTFYNVTSNRLEYGSGIDVYMIWYGPLQ
jgi:hypothetical protein